MDILRPGAKYDSGGDWRANGVHSSASATFKVAEETSATEEDHSYSVRNIFTTPFVCVWRGICQFFSWVVTCCLGENNLRKKQIAIYKMLQKWSKTHVTRGDQKGYLRKKYAEARLQQIKTVRSKDDPYLLNLTLYLFDPLIEEMVGLPSTVSVPENAFAANGDLCRRLKKVINQLGHSCEENCADLEYLFSRRFVETKEYENGGASRLLLYHHVSMIVDGIEKVVEEKQKSILAELVAYGCEDRAATITRNVMIEAICEKFKNDTGRHLSLMVLQHKLNIINETFGRQGCKVKGDVIEYVRYYQILLNEIGLCVVPSGTLTNEPSEHMSYAGLVKNKKSFEEALNEICPYFTLNCLEYALNHGKEWGPLAKKIFLRKYQEQHRCSFKEAEKAYEDKLNDDLEYDVSDVTREELIEAGYATTDPYYDLPCEFQ